MKLDKAIKTLSFWEALFKDYHDKRLKDALKLGIEALKYIQYRDDYHGVNTRLLLPGETKE